MEPLSVAATTVSTTDVIATLRLVNEDRLCCECFKAQVYSTSYGPRAVDGHRRDCHTLPRIKAKFPPVLQVNRKAPVDNDEQLIRLWVIVPAVFAIENCEP
jgi:hypothetical protein